MQIHIAIFNKVCLQCSSEFVIVCASVCNNSWIVTVSVRIQPFTVHSVSIILNMDISK